LYIYLILQQHFLKSVPLGSGGIAGVVMFATAMVQQRGTAALLPPGAHLETGARKNS
jgi:hypothetical protein